MTMLHRLTKDDLADYLVENDPAFKTRIEEAFDEYLTRGGITADAVIKKLKRPHTLLPTSKRNRKMLSKSRP